MPTAMPSAQALLWAKWQGRHRGCRVIYFGTVGTAPAAAEHG